MALRVSRGEVPMRPISPSRDRPLPPIPNNGTLEKLISPPPANLRPPLPLLPSSSKDETVSHGTIQKKPPPVLPPKLPAFNDLQSTDQPYFDSYNILQEPEELSVLELVERYQELFPLRVYVSRGFYGSNERFTLSEGDVYNIHFVKKTTVITVIDCSQIEHKIALNSSVQFGMLYNPEGNFQKAKDGYSYSKVSDIMAISPLPKVVRVTVEFKGTTPNNSIMKNELLIIKEIIKKGSRRHLVVYSVTASKIKHLFESCEGHFSTHPNDVCLFLPEILKHVPNPFPMVCYLFLNSITSQEIPYHLTSSAATLVGETVDTSLIASSSIETDSGRPLLIEIPIDLDIQVQVMQPKDATDTESLSEQTYDLFENLDITKVVQCTNVIQSAGQGMELVKSQAMKHWIDVHSKDSIRYSKLPPNQHALSLMRNNEPLSCSTESEMLYEKESNAPPIPTTDTLYDTSHDNQSRDLVSIRADIKRMDNKVMKELTSLKEQVEKLSQIVNSNVQSRVVDNTPEDDEDTKVTRRSSSAESYISSADRVSNITFLHTLDTVDVSGMCRERALCQ